MKKLVSLLLAVAMLLACTAAFADVITTGSVTVRAKADRNSKKLTTLHTGVVIEGVELADGIADPEDRVDDNGNDIVWVPVYVKGMKGYISSKYCKDFEGEEYEFQFEIGDVLKTTAKAHVRKSASKSASTNVGINEKGGKGLSIVPAGTVCEVVDCKLDSRDVEWYKVQCVNSKGNNISYGWISGKYLKLAA